MNIGFFTKNETGAIVGDLPTMGLRGVNLEPIKKEGNGPDYRAVMEGAELGAAWKRTSRAGNPFLSFSVIRPGFPVVYLAVLKTDAADQYRAVYSVPKRSEQSEESGTENF